MVMNATIKRGPRKGAVLRPHLHEDGTYVASSSRYEKDYERHSTLDALESRARAGMHIRMSEGPGHPASLISPASIDFSGAGTDKNMPATLADLERLQQVMATATGMALAIALDRIDSDARARFLDAFETVVVDHLEPEPALDLTLEQIQEGAESAPRFRG